MAVRPEPVAGLRGHTYREPATVTVESDGPWAGPVWRGTDTSMEQELKFGLSVVTTDERDVGTLHRVVIDGGTLQVSGIVVQRRLLESGNLLKPGGWEKPRDQLVPIAAVLGADEDEVRIS